MHRASQCFSAGVLQHRASQHVFGFRMSRHTKTGHVDADDANAVNFFGQDLQWHAAGGGHAQIDDDNGVVQRGVSLLEDCFANVFKQLAGYQ